jgi:hypothetical protein
VLGFLRGSVLSFVLAGSWITGHSSVVGLVAVGLVRRPSRLRSVSPSVSDDIDPSRADLGFRRPRDDTCAYRSGSGAVPELLRRE